MIGWPYKTSKGGFKSEDTWEFFRCQHKYSKSLFWAENLNFSPNSKQLIQFFPQDSDLECLFWRSKHSQVSSDLKPPLLCTTVWLSCEWAFKISKQIHICNIFFLLKKHLTRKFHHWLESWFNFPFKKGHTFYQIKCDILGRELWPGTLTFRISSILLACLGLHWPACLVCLGRIVWCNLSRVPWPALSLAEVGLWILAH